jgi:hypothetical protein
MRKQLLLSVFIVAFSLIALPWARPVEAANLEFDETELSVNVDDTFHIQVVVDAGSEQIISTDAYVSYDATLLEAQSVAEGTFFPTVTKNITSGKVYVAGMVDDPATSKTGSGTVATITFKALKNGIATLSYSCNPDEYNTSKIIKNDVDTSDIITCSENGEVEVTISGSDTDSESSTTSGMTPTPSSLPKSGILENILSFAIPGILLLVIGGGLRFVL